MRSVREFQDSGFSLTALPLSDLNKMWRYSITHRNKNAMTLHLLRCEDPRSFTVLIEPDV